MAGILSGLLTGDSLGPGLLGGPLWGIFGQTGAPIIVADSVNDISYARDYLLSDAPQEQGAFMTYNKVQVPFDAKVGFLTSQTRNELLNTLEPLVASLELVAVVTPEVSYPSANLVHYDLKRTARNGVTLILVIVWAREVRIIGQAPPTVAQSTNAASPTQSGQVQTIPAGNATIEDITISSGGQTLSSGPPTPLPTPN
jgi:hypothetical protein